MIALPTIGQIWLKKPVKHIVLSTLPWATKFILILQKLENNFLRIDWCNLA